MIALNPKEACTHLHGILSPKGEFYPCNYMGHRDLICDLYDHGKIDSDDYGIVEDKGWIKYSITSMGTMKFEFMFAFVSDVKFHRPAKEGEKSFLKIGDTYMVDDRYEVGHLPTKEQIEFILEFKRCQREENLENWNEVIFNSKKYKLEDFYMLIKKECEDWQRYFKKENIKCDETGKNI